MQLACVFLGTALILLIPLLAMQFTEKVNWDLADFLAAGVLLAGTGLAYVLLVRKLTSPRSRLVAGALLGLAFLLAWAELAVGLFH
ncbi:MAG: hypothetical protein H7176_11355 [Bdellovibrionales bacterium]|nr:hypothetical protein [Massilia sp.]